MRWTVMVVAGVRQPGVSLGYEGYIREGDMLRQFAQHAVTMLGSMALVIATTNAAVGARPIDRSDTARATAQNSIVIAFRSEPEPSMTIGDNTFEVRVKDSAGKPIPNAHVKLFFYMSGWPIKRMPDVRNEIDLQSAGGGVYRGIGTVTMAGPWQVTVDVKRDGKDIGKRQLTITAQ